MGKKDDRAMMAIEMALLTCLCSYSEAFLSVGSLD
jgi:hypothetical protein